MPDRNDGRREAHLGQRYWLTTEMYYYVRGGFARSEEFIIAIYSDSDSRDRKSSNAGAKESCDRRRTRNHCRQNHQRRNQTNGCSVNTKRTHRCWARSVKLLVSIRCGCVLRTYRIPPIPQILAPSSPLNSLFEKWNLLGAVSLAYLLCFYEQSTTLINDTRIKSGNPESFSHFTRRAHLDEPLLLDFWHVVSLSIASSFGKY